MFSRRGALGVVGAAILAGAGSARATGRIAVVATTGMIADAVRRIGGDRVDVRALMGPGVDPHSYRQTRTDIVAMTRADLTLYHGLYLEAQMEDFLIDLSARRSVSAITRDLPQDRLLAHDTYADKVDPHVWMDPGLWTVVTGTVRDALTEADPRNAVAYEEAAAVFAADIEALATYSAETLADVPQRRRVLVTAHDAFAYFGAAYGFEVMGIQGISTESEAGLNRIGELVDTLVERDIGAVFVETSVSDRNIRALIEGAAARGHVVQVGGELFSDAMGPEGTYEGTYIGMIDHNVTTIARALGADAPARGMSGQLSAGF